MKVVLSQSNFIGVLRRMRVTYTATLTGREETVLFVSSLPHAERQRRGTRAGTIQVIPAPDGWPLWTSPVRPGREHDTTALREHTQMLPLLAMWTEDQLRVLGDLGYEGEADTITVAFKKPKGGELTDVQKTYNKVHNGIRAVGERGNSLLKTTFKALRHVSLCPWKISKIAAAALVLLHVEHGRTT